MNNPRMVLVTIAVLFFAPLLLAMLMRSGWWDFQPSSLSNRGTLVHPVSALPPGALGPMGPSAGADCTGRWIVLYLLPEACAVECRHELANLRQVHLASGRDRERVEICLLGQRPLSQQEMDELHGIYPDFRLLLDRGGAAKSLLAALTGPDGEGFGSAMGQAFLLDPAANIILRYAPGFDPQDLSQDLDRLLTWTPDE